ncbi:MAG: TolC family protein [Pirellulaceae bacterium]|nr:TolC family protein [Pirellulaceae bacterium]
MRPPRLVLRLCLAMGLSTGGCAINRDKFEFCKPADLECAQPTLGTTQLASADAALCAERDSMYAEPVSPLDIDETMLSSDRLFAMTLEDCIRQALASSKIMRDLGGTVIRSPQTISSNLDPALVYSDPRGGEVAALSAFDANFFVSNYFEKNDRGLNNQFFGRNGSFVQELNTTQMGVNKRSATGGLYALRNITSYDRNNQLSNRFPLDSWDTYVEAEMRQPLLQGAGTEFNRIAGPGATAGQLNGVVLARVRTDISLTDFERAVRDLVAEVENAYWDLYYSYRDLEARIEVRDIAQQTLNTLDEKATGKSKIAQAEEQVHRFQSEVVDSINGRPIDGTRLNNGSTAGTFRSAGGLRISERKLRLMIGLPINDGRLIRPVQSPSMAPVTYDWNASISEALRMREELRRQRWVIKQRELELTANRNFLKPQLDLISRYRFRGFGEELLGPSSATSSLYDGQFQEWQAGLEYNMPVGFRRAAAAVQNSRLALAREVEVLREQERFVHFGLSNAINEAKRARENLALQHKRLDAIVYQLNAIDARQEAEKAELDVRLETHRRLLDARLRYHQAEVEYVLALRNVNFEKGSLLTYCNIVLAESMPNPKAQLDANERIQFRDFDRSTPVRDSIIAKPADRAASMPGTDMSSAETMQSIVPMGEVQTMPMEIVPAPQTGPEFTPGLMAPANETPVVPPPQPSQATMLVPMTPMAPMNPMMAPVVAPVMMPMSPVAPVPGGQPLGAVGGSLRGTVAPAAFNQTLNRPVFTMPVPGSGGRPNSRSMSGPASVAPASFATPPSPSGQRPQAVPVPISTGNLWGR